MKKYIKGGVALLTISSLTNHVTGNTHMLTQKSLNRLRSHQKSKQGDESNDGIATSTTDDMFAFSQIIAGGEKVSEITREMENQG